MGVSSSHCGEGILERLHRGLVEQQRHNAVPLGQQAADDEPALDNEQVAPAQ